MCVFGPDTTLEPRAVFAGTDDRKGRAGPISRLPSIWSRYLAAWESTWYPGWAEQHAALLGNHFTSPLIPQSWERAARRRHSSIYI